jgi:hypothetical protein
MDLAGLRRADSYVMVFDLRLTIPTKIPAQRSVMIGEIVIACYIEALKVTCELVVTHFEFLSQSKAKRRRHYQNNAAKLSRETVAELHCRCRVTYTTPSPQNR